MNLKQVYRGSGCFLHTKPGLGYKTLTNGGGLNRYPILSHLSIQKEPDELTPSP